MKKLLSIIILIILTIVLASCNNSEKKITCEDIIKVYEEAGYEVFHKENDLDGGEICYVKCSAPDKDDYIFFNFYETKEDAKLYAKEREWNIILFIYSCAMFEPTWLTTKTYNNIEIEYDKNYLYEPFKSLL